MADDDDYGDGSDFDGFKGGDGKRSGKRKIVILFVIFVLLAAAVAAGLYVFSGGGSLIEVISSVMSEKTDEADAPDEMDLADAPIFFDLPEMLVNLSAAGRQRVYLRVRVALELEEQDDIALVDRLMPRVIDSFQIYLRELRIEDLNGSAGMYRLQEELLTRVNAAVAPTKVRGVLFKEMLIQ